jgi:putative ABC transport system substrate-binding protein
MTFSRRKLLLAIPMAFPFLPRVLQAQGETQLRRVGVLISGREDKGTLHRLSVFKEAMEKLRWIEGETVQYEVRWGNGNADENAAGAMELIDMAPDVVLTVGTPATEAMQRGSRTIPIVFAIVADPVGAGFVESLAQPGGNVTGFITYYPEFVGKWVELLREVAPQIARVGLLYNPRTSPFEKDQFLQPFLQQAALDHGVEPVMLAVENQTQIRGAILEMTGPSKGGLIVMPDSFMIGNRAVLIENAAKNKVPVIYPFSPFANGGGLMSYGIDMADITRRSAMYIDRILKGEPPASLPVQAPTKFELLVNMKAADALGLSLPPSILLRADDVIE